MTTNNKETPMTRILLASIITIGLTGLAQAQSTGTMNHSTMKHGTMKHSTMKHTTMGHSMKKHSAMSHTNAQ
jgi:pentapeptide MXKDX repeat protein